MKKVIAGLFLLLVLAIIAVFIFIPAQLHISAAAAMKANTNALSRYLSDETKWAKWWPQENEEKRLITQNNRFELNAFTYHLTKKLYNSAEVAIIKKGQIINSKIFIIPLAGDSLIVKWQSAFKTSLNPFTRIAQYQQAVKIKKNMTVILGSLTSFGENKEMIYKFPIYHTTLKNTSYISEKTVTSGYPSTAFIYKMIENLRMHASAQKAVEVDFPILNITKKDSVHYEVMAAIPINKVLEGNGNFAFKRMIAYPDKIVTADVKGGPEKIKEAYNELDTYMNDYNLTAPVISWETLVTDRSKETDSTKWVTKICVPIV